MELLYFYRDALSGTSTKPIDAAIRVKLDAAIRVYTLELVIDHEEMQDEEFRQANEFAGWEVVRS